VTRWVVSFTLLTLNSYKQNDETKWHTKQLTFSRRYSLHPTEQYLLKKVSSKLGPRILFDRPWSSSQGLRVITATSLLMTCLVKQLIKVVLNCNFGYQSTGCYIPQVSLDTWRYSVPLNIWTYNACWRRYLVSLIETNVFNFLCLLCMSFSFIFVFNHLT